MKRIFIILFSLVPLYSIGQIKIPYFQSNMEEYQHVPKKLFKITRKFDFSITLEAESYWYKGNIYKILGYKKGQWSRIYFVNDIKDSLGNVAVGKNKIVKLHSDKVLSDSLYRELVLNHLFLINQDSLSLDSKTILGEPGMYHHFLMSDGETLEFIVTEKDKVGVWYCQDPEKRSEFLPDVMSIKYLANCSKLFKNFWNATDQLLRK